jgi:hypothetical protein
MDLFEAFLILVGFLGLVKMENCMSEKLIFLKCTNKCVKNSNFAQMKVQNNGRVIRSF